ncbi:splicing factor Tls1 [Schizosaccharomyces osmophilus]|uniref:Splicing factor Tls1 n=1 Tax=Schizosaccharomyces osmophilus TaxID=2545709 RepID=A0AAF0AU70_9SCHI|nr:splicing factor Tls1 [Schizosaccharomyces osmophilus]WBW71058.1 splicing factor Tls1 [Schizosaccharomyces osmophilus]
MSAFHHKKKGDRSNIRKRVFEPDPLNETDHEGEDNTSSVRSILEDAKRRKTKLISSGVNASNLIDGNKKEIKSSLNDSRFEVPANEDTIQDSASINATLPTVEDRFAKPTNEIDVNQHLLSYIESKINHDKQGLHPYEKNENSVDVIPRKETDHENASTVVADLPNNAQKNSMASGAIQEVDVGITSTNLDSSKGSASKRKRKGLNKTNPTPTRSSEDLARDRIIEDMLKSSAGSTNLENELYKRFRSNDTR